MAGNYPDVPGPRMAYDRDGTVVTNSARPSGTTSVLTPAQVSVMNNEDANEYVIWNTSDGTNLMAWLFPELRDVVGYRLQGGREYVNIGPLETSVDTTNGLDGAWTLVNSSSTWVRSTNANPVVNKEDLRSNILPVNIVGTKAIRFTVGTFGTRFFSAVHLYGKPSAGQNPDRLQIWHPTLNQEVGGAHFDWGDAARATSADRTFRIKNNSATLTANTVIVSTEAPTDTTPSVPAQHSLEKVSAPGFTATVQIPSLAPGAISEIITVRRVTPSNAAVALWWARMLASAATWT